VQLVGDFHNSQSACVAYTPALQAAALRSKMAHLRSTGVTKFMIVFRLLNNYKKPKHCHGNAQRKIRT